MKPRKPVRIGNVSGFFGDRMSAMQEMLEGGPVDVLTGDYLAEVTMSILWKQRERDPDAGFATTFLRQLEPLIGEILERGVKVVVNAGGLNPSGLADRIGELAIAGGRRAKVAHIEGDDLVPRIPDLQAAGESFTNLQTGELLDPTRTQLLTANAYLGAWGIVTALEAGADIVVTPRVADASLVVGAAAWWHGWGRDQFDELAGALVAGHVIECGAQVTGGNFSGFREIADLTHPGFPLAEVAADGSSVITKHVGTGGAVTVDTVTAQLLYEIQGPDYLNADVTALFDSIHLEQQDVDRVRVSGVRGGPPPVTAKVSATTLGGYRNELTFVLTGLDQDAKANLVEQAVRGRIDGRPGLERLEFQRVGTAATDPASENEASTLLRVVATGSREDAVGRAFSGALIELALANYPGLYATGVPGKARVFARYWPTTVAQHALQHAVVHPDGTRVHVEPVPGEQDPTRPRAVPTIAPLSGETRSVPLGTVVHARSGDKGGTANVGLWSDTDEGFVWLLNALTVERLRDLMPEAAGLDVERHVLENLRALNFLIHGLMGEGATSSVRFDAQAKGLGEFLRARHVDVPVRLLGSARPQP